MPGNWEDHHEREQGPSRRKSQPTGMLQSQHIWRRGNLPPAPSSFLLSVLTAACCLLEVPETVELGQGPLPPSRRTLDGSRFAIPQAFRNNCHGSFLSKSFNCLTYSLEFSWGHKHSGGHKGNPSVHVVKLLPRPQRPPRCHDGAQCSTSCSHLPLHSSQHRASTARWQLSEVASREGQRCATTA